MDWVFSKAVELARIDNPSHMSVVANAVLQNGLTRNETRQVVQLLDRSERPVDDILDEVMGMREVIMKRYIYIGSLDQKQLIEALKKLSQRERDANLLQVTEDLGF